MATTSPVTRPATVTGPSATTIVFAVAPRGTTALPETTIWSRGAACAAGAMRPAISATARPSLAARRMRGLSRLASGESTRSALAGARLRHPAVHLRLDAVGHQAAEAPLRLGGRRRRHDALLAGHHRLEAVPRDL